MKAHHNPLLICILWLLSYTASAQYNESEPVYTIEKIDTTLTIDGVADEAAWKQAEPITGLYQHFPTDSVPAEDDARIRMLFSEQFLYIHFVGYYSLKQDYVISSLRRDFNWNANNNIAIYLGTFLDRANGFAFYVTPAGVEREGLMTLGGDVDDSWDNKWYSAVKRYPDRWEAEMAIPFKSIRYKKGERRWNINVLRHNVTRNEQTVWGRVPQGFRPSSLVFARPVEFAEPLPKTGVNMAVIPYLSGQMNQETAEGESPDYEVNAGFDAKFGITPSLNLDLTVNPDFSQVEVDRQVTNLSRFELFFPERRQFFLENQDLFADFGTGGVRPFFSRRIGIGRDTLTNQIVQNPILFGARLSGKLSNRWRVGLLNMQTGRIRESGIAPQNYTVAVGQMKVLSGSNVGAIFVNHENPEDDENPYTRVGGVDFNFLDKNNRWAGNFFYHRAFLPDQPRDAQSSGGFIDLTSRNFGFRSGYEYVGRNYDINEIGFVARRNYVQNYNFFRYTIYPDNAKVFLRHNFNLFVSNTWNLDGLRTDHEYRVSYSNELLNRWEYNISWTNGYIYLFDSFDPTNTDGEELPADTDYTTNRLAFSFDSDNRKRLFFGGDASYGGYFNGTRWAASGYATYRIQPYGSVSLSVNHNRIELPVPYKSASLWLVSPRLDFAFTRSLFLTTFLQYNNQSDNINLNARFQWRFKPVSDLFIVYSENYFPNTLQSKTRALVFKLSYWLNW